MLSWMGVGILHRSQLRALSTYRVQALRRHLSVQGDSLDSLGQMLAKSWTSLHGVGQASEHAVHAALPLLRQHELVSNLILCAPDGSFLTLVRATMGWDLIEGGPAFGPGRGRLTRQVDTPGSRKEWIQLPEGFPTARPWFREGMSLTHTGWMDRPYAFSGTTTGGLSYLVPVIDGEGHRLGLICIDSTQMRVSQAMASILENPFSRAMITDASHRVIVPPQWPSMPDPGDAFQTPTFEEIPWAQALLAHSPKGQKPAMASAIIDDLSFLTFRTPVDLGSTFHGELWVAYPMAVAVTPFFRSGGVAVTLLLCLLMLAWLIYIKWMSGRYDRPMRRLMDSAEAARKGIEVPNLDSEIWEIRQMGRSLQLVGQMVRDRQGLEDQLVQTQRFEIMSALSGGVIHDVNNVLAIIMLRIERALDRGWQPRSVEDLREGLEAAGQCVAMNRQLLNLGRKDEEPVHRLDLNDCIRDASLLVRPALGRELSLELDLAPEGLPVALCAVELTQAILNLALNARDAMPEGGLLQIRTQRQGAEAHLEIEDGGEGIPASLHDRIFEPYFTTKAKGKGTGLGLAVVKRVVERNLGRIELRRYPGRGQCFLLAFPLLEETT